MEIEGERVDFDLRERKKQVRRPLTEEEKRTHYARERGFVQEMQLTGELIFSLKTHLVDGAKHEWRDGEKTLEFAVTGHHQFDLAGRPDPEGTPAAPRRGGTAAPGTGNAPL